VWALPFFLPAFLALVSVKSTVIMDEDEELCDVCDSEPLGNAERGRKVLVSARQVRRRTQQRLAELLAQTSATAPVEKKKRTSEMEVSDMRLDSSTPASVSDVQFDSEDEQEQKSLSEVITPYYDNNDSGHDPVNFPVIENQDSNEANSPDSSEVWLDTTQCGSLQFDCPVCINCSCSICEVCHHDPEFKDCIHCDSCLDGYATPDDCDDCDSTFQDAMIGSGYEQDDDDEPSGVATGGPKGG